MTLCPTEFGGDCAPESIQHMQSVERWEEFSPSLGRVQSHMYVWLTKPLSQVCSGNYSLHWSHWILKCPLVEWISGGHLVQACSDPGQRKQAAQGLINWLLSTSRGIDLQLSPAAIVHRNKLDTWGKAYHVNDMARLTWDIQKILEHLERQLKAKQDVIGLFSYHWNPLTEYNHTCPNMEPISCVVCKDIRSQHCGVVKYPISTGPHPVLPHLPDVPWQLHQAQDSFSPK